MVLLLLMVIEVVWGMWEVDHAGIPVEYLAVSASCRSSKRVLLHLLNWTVMVIWNFLRAIG